VDDKILISPKTRGLRVQQIFTDLDIAKQLELAAQFNLCPTLIPWGGRTRICGQEVRLKDTGRHKCGTCPERYDVYDGPPFVPKNPTIQLQTSTRVDIWPTKPPETNAAELEEFRAQIAELQKTIGELTEKNTELMTTNELLTKATTIKAHTDEIWDDSFSKQTIRNARSCLKRAAQLLGLTFNSQAIDFVDRVAQDVDGFFKKIQGDSDIPNTISKSRRFLAHFKQREICKRLTELEKEHYPKKSKETSQKLTEKQLVQLGDCGRHLGVNLQRERPAALLLERLRAQTMEFVAESAEDRRWKLDQLLLWWLPAHRGGTTRFKVARKLPSTPDQIRETALNLVGWDGEQVTGLYIGHLKKSMKQYKHLWWKRITVTPEGISTHNEADVLPCHLDEDEWQQWVRCVFAVLQAQLEEGDTKSGQYVFRATESERLRQRDLIETYAMEFYGSEFHCQLGRIIFRNGVPRSDEFFLTYVMQHAKRVDETAYVKPVLRDGPLPNRVSQSDRASPADEEPESPPAE
jgi:hypothetical protein